MTVTLVPLPSGLDGDVEQRLQYLINAVNGYAGQGVRFNLTAYRHDERYALQVRNEGTPGGGLHLGVWASNAALTATPIFEVQDSGVFATVPAEIDANATITGTVGIGGNLGVNGALTVLGAGQFGGTITGDAGLDLIGGAEISGTVILHSQWQSTVTVGAPFTVASSSAVTNLNADLLDGFHASHFATISDLADYVLRAGDTMTGVLTMEPATPSDVAIKLKNSSIGSGMTIGTGVGSNDAAAPALIFRDHLGVDMLEVGNSFSSVYYATVKGDFHVQGAADFDSDMTLGNSSADTITVPGATDFQAGVGISGSGNIDGNGGTAGQLRIGALIANAASLASGEKLRVVGISRLEGLIQSGSTGAVLSLVGSSQTQTTVGAAGGASALPATPLGYLKATVGATSIAIPYYNA